MYLYDPIGYDQELWAYLPTMLRGRITMNKRNTADALQLDLLNYMHGYTEEDPQWQLYTDFSFANRPILVESRVSDGYEWTGWRTIFIGCCDEKEIEEREDGDTVLTVTARDKWRKKLMETHLIRAYADGAAVEGLITGKCVSDIIQDISQEGCGLPYSALQCQATPHNKPKTFNIAGDSAASAIQKLLEDTALCWYPRLSDFQIQVRDWFFGTDSPGYSLSTRDEVETVRWSHRSQDALAILELNIENTEFMGGGFSTNFPHAPVPYYGRVAFESAVVAQTATSLYGRPIHYLRWKRENREVGSIEVRMQAQDWVEHDLEIAVYDHKYLGLGDRHGPWVVDGWTHDWEGSSKFDTTLELVNQHPDRILRASLQGYY
jgi:hypothetical protein